MIHPTLGGHFGARVDGNIKLSIFLMKWGWGGHWGHWGCWGYWGHWGCRGFKAWKITAGDFRVIQVLEFSFILMFWKHHQMSTFNFYTFSVWGWWDQLVLIFWKFVLRIKISTSQDFKNTFNYNLTCVFLCLRAKLKTPLCPWTPCIWYITLQFCGYWDNFFHIIHRMSLSPTSPC